MYRDKKKKGTKGGRMEGRKEERKGLLDKVKKYRQQRNYSGGQDPSVYFGALEETTFIL
jgi:hypothetical protein